MSHARLRAATPVALAVNLASGAVWLSVGPTLEQFSDTGAPLTTQTLAEAPKVLAYDLATVRRLAVYADRYAPTVAIGALPAGLALPQRFTGHACGTASC